MLNDLSSAQNVRLGEQSSNPFQDEEAVLSKCAEHRLRDLNLLVDVDEVVLLSGSLLLLNLLRAWRR